MMALDTRRFTRASITKPIARSACPPGIATAETQHPALRVEAVRAEFELTGVHRTNPENFIRKIAGVPKDY